MIKWILNHMQGPTGIPVTQKATAAGAAHVTHAGRPPLGREVRTVGIAAVGLASIPAGATIAYVSIECAVASGVSETLRFRVDGAAATGTDGHEIEDRERLVLDDATQLTNFSIIRDSAATADGKITVTYF